MSHSTHTMAKELRLLNQAHIAKPCPANWDEMKGDDRSRHCSMCRLNVFNLSDMTDDEAEKLLRDRTGRLCVRYYLRPDGKIMTKDCPKGLKAFRQKLAKQYVLAATLILGALGCSENDKYKKAFGLDKFEQEPHITMGAIACPPSPTPSPTATSGPSIKMGEVAAPTVGKGIVAPKDSE